MELDALTYLRRAWGLAVSSSSFFAALTFCRAVFRRAWLFFFWRSPLCPAVISLAFESTGPSSVGVGALSSSVLGSWGGSWGGMTGDGDGDGGKEDRGKRLPIDDRSNSGRLRAATEGLCRSVWLGASPLGFCRYAE